MCKTAKTIAREKLLKKHFPKESGETLLEMLNMRLKDSKSNAKGRTGPAGRHTIGINYLIKLFIKSKGRCALSGRAFDYIKKSEDNASLDRIDSSKGYIYGNLQFVTKRVNLGKRNQSDPEFREWCGDVYRTSLAMAI